jgi:hypothetical protein
MRLNELAWFAIGLVILVAAGYLVGYHNGQGSVIRDIPHAQLDSTKTDTIRVPQKPTDITATVPLKPVKPFKPTTNPPKDSVASQGHVEQFVAQLDTTFPQGRVSIKALFVPDSLKAVFTVHWQPESLAVVHVVEYRSVPVIKKPSLLENPYLWGGIGLLAGGYIVSQVRR